MSAWQVPHEGQQGGEATGPEWQYGGQYDWDFGPLDNSDDFWENDLLDDFLPASPGTPPSTTIHPNAYNTLFPPPHDFLARTRERTLPASHRETNATVSQTAPGSDSRPNTQARPPDSSTTNQEGRFGYIVDHLFDLPSPSVSDSSFIVLGETSSSELDEAEMPPATRRATARRSSLVDLTSGSSSQNTADAPGRRGGKRRAEDSAGGPSKRRARESSRSREIEEIDLANEVPSAEEELRRQQQEETIRAQQAAQKDQVPQRIGQRQCIICMENYTNATVTSCGHFFCHECLSQALAAGERNSERGVGSCPVCRKPLSRKKKHEVIPIAFMKREQFATNQSKRTDILA